MLTPDERAALVVYCSDHPVAVCPVCREAVPANRIGADLIVSRRDFCPVCRADLTPTLRKHLADCTWAREAGERAQEYRQRARETVKQSQ